MEIEKRNKKDERRRPRKREEMRVSQMKRKSTGQLRAEIQGQFCQQELKQRRKGKDQTAHKETKSTS
jgi:hypothetical protein